MRMSPQDPQSLQHADRRGLAAPALGVMRKRNPGPKPPCTFSRIILIRSVDDLAASSALAGNVDKAQKVLAHMPDYRSGIASVQYPAALSIPPRGGSRHGREGLRVAGLPDSRAYPGSRETSDGRYCTSAGALRPLPSSTDRPVAGRVPRRGDREAPVCCSDEVPVVVLSVSFAAMRNLVPYRVTAGHGWTAARPSGLPRCNQAANSSA